MAALKWLGRQYIFVQLRAGLCCRLNQHSYFQLTNQSNRIISARSFFKCVTWTLNDPAATANSRAPCVEHSIAAFHTCHCLPAQESSDAAKRAIEQKKKDKLASRISLLDSGGNPMGVMKKSEAILLAKNNDQILVEVNPTTFKLVDQKGVDLRKDKPGSRYSSKPKQLIIKSKITDHDLEVKLKHVTTWLEKEHEVFIVINNTDPSQPQRMSQLLQTITEAYQHLAVVKQVERTDELLRLILKPKEDSSSKGNKPPDILKFTDMKKVNPK